jgi:hypothetical protein|eukprot:COSAG01_NODE_5070_length_4509_cov_11.031066_3_plen_33_part_00
MPADFARTHAVGSVLDDEQHCPLVWQLARNKL